jgi:nicotinate-nucleotide--dimethylbenzimidazole phosphoribosyltransferase
VTEPEPQPLLLGLGAGIGWPDNDAEFATLERLGATGMPASALGRLGDLAAWLGGVQGICPPREPMNPRLILFAADHGVAELGVSAYPPGSTATRLAAIAAGDGVAAVFAAASGVGVRVVDAGGGVASGRIDVEDALSAEATTLAIETGVRVADEEIDAGADLLAVGALGRGSSTAAAAIVSIMSLTEPIRVIAQGTLLSDAAWMTKVAAIRDARLRGLPHRHDVHAQLSTIGGADLAAMLGFLLRAAARRTPVVLDGMVVAAAALLAREVAPNIVRWWQSGQLTTDPAHRLALAEFTAESVLDLGLSLGEGVGAVLAVPIIRAAARAANDVAITVEPAPTADEPGPEPVIDGPGPEPAVDGPEPDTTG